jgi:hypothetical protein
VQQVSDTDRLEHEAGPEVEQPELILLNKLDWSAGLDKSFRCLDWPYGLANDKPMRAPKTRVVTMVAGSSLSKDKTAVKEDIFDGFNQGEQSYLKVGRILLGATSNCGENVRNNMHKSFHRSVANAIS